MKKMLILDSNYNMVEADAEVVSRILREKGYCMEDIKKHSTQTALFDDIRAYLKRKED